MKNLLDIIKGNMEWVDTLKQIQQLDYPKVQLNNYLELLINYLEESSELLDYYDDKVRQTKTIVDMLAKLP